MMILQYCGSVGYSTQEKKIYSAQKIYLFAADTPVILGVGS